ncbi:hypothetical protein [Ornithinibacillus halotolerans]|uniref:Uncharacterized protein n=1 Tax=Ornithinibacillus halotolerans TaxID=1274357 RepID=A0A916W284_9BACI|nr:hypothetical protein [Ornithinibacillus halotolerans]GGA60215.1 hypothetical protein GCM10008025_00290 [Ornithinibacillus halotolerans]
MQSSQWLQGGPFLEVSFLLQLKEDKRKTIQFILDNLSKVNNNIEIVDDNIGEVMDAFEVGYPYDEGDVQTTHIHSFSLNLYVYLTRRRKSVLQIDLVSSNTVMVNFMFYGSTMDAGEWEQIGIEQDEYTDFTNFLKNLYAVYEFEVGGIAMEENVLELFGSEEIYPNECYRYEALDPERFLQESSAFIDIIWKDTNKKLLDVPFNHVRLDKQGILIHVCSFND